MQCLAYFHYVDSTSETVIPVAQDPIVYCNAPKLVTKHFIEFVIFFENGIVL